jgi:RNA polymerase sigma-70 factor (ECF subfamily)
MDVATAARTMGLPEGTVKARLSRGRELLRKRFPHLNEQSTPLSSIPRPKKEVLQ